MLYMTQLNLSARLSSHAKREVGAYDCGGGSERKDPICALGEGTARSPALQHALRAGSAAQVSQPAEVAAGVEENWFASSESGKINKVKNPLIEVYR